MNGIINNRIFHHRVFNERDFKMTILRSWMAAVAVCAGLAMFSSGALANVIIDDFDAGSTTLVIVGGGSDANTETASGVIGAEREVELISAGGISSSAVNLGGNGMFIQGSLDGATVGRLVYDGVGASGLGGIDLTEGGVGQKLVFRGLTVDTGSVDATVTINGVTVALPTLTGPVSGNFEIDLSLFGGAELAADSIVIEASLGPNTDLSVDAIFTSTPEPATLAIWTVMSCCGVGLVRRRRS